MTLTNTQKYFKDGEYDKLTEDERNAIVARMEDWRYDEYRGCWYSLDGISATRYLNYLSSWELLGPLIGKYGLDILKCGDEWEAHDMSKHIKDYDEWPSGDGPTPEAAIVHALCEIAKEQHKEKEYDE